MPCPERVTQKCHTEDDAVGGDGLRVRPRCCGVARTSAPSPRCQTGRGVRQRTGGGRVSPSGAGGTCVRGPRAAAHTADVRLLQEAQGSRGRTQAGPCSAPAPHGASRSGSASPLDPESAGGREEGQGGTLAWALDLRHASPQAAASGRTGPDSAGSSPGTSSPPATSSASRGGRPGTFRGLVHRLRRESFRWQREHPVTWGHGEACRGGVASV